MSQRLTQEQKLEQTQQQRISQQQMIAARLIEKPIEELMLDIENELYKNPALEKEHNEDADFIEPEYNKQEKENNESEKDIIAEQEKEDREDELTKALNDMGRDDDREERGDGAYYDENYKEIENGNQESFIDNLNEQMGELELSETEEKVMNYLIGSLHSDGLLHETLDNIAERLYIDEYLDVKEEDVEKVLLKLQTFDPAGVGARNLQECLLLQINRMDDGETKDKLNIIIGTMYDEFSKNHWDTIQSNLSLSDEETEQLKKTIKHRLTPKPGSAFGETIGISLDRITPDFIVYVTDDDKIRWEVNSGNIPNLSIADSFEMMMNSYKDIDDKQLSKQEREAKQFAMSNVNNGNIYINALRQRQLTMEAVMKVIVKKQRNYFLTGDDAELRPMKLEDIAEKTGLDTSTISRVSREKYIQTPWGIVLMKKLFTSGYVNEEGEEMSVKKVKAVLKDIIDNENKKKPLSDDSLEKAMKAKGYNIARRTIAKYREQMGIPIARMRKE